MLNINPKMLRRPDEIEYDLLARRASADHEAWRGEVKGVDLTLTFLRQKRVETKRLASRRSNSACQPSQRRRLCGVGHLTLDDLAEIERRLVDAVMSGEQLDLVVPDEEISPEAMTGWGRTARSVVK